MHDFWRDTLPCPSLWGYISDTIVDMCNELIHNPHWGHSRIFDELSTTVEEQLRYLLLSQISSGTNSFQWYQKSWYLHWQFHRSCTRCQWQSNQSQCSSPISNTRLLSSIEQQNPIPRNEIISLKKFRAEGRMEEVMKVLGWIINTRSLTTSLPHDKHSKWSSSIDNIISEGKCNIKNLEILLGFTKV